MANWQIYAAVTSSAAAMMTNASASDIYSQDSAAPEPFVSATAMRQNTASARNFALIEAVKLAMERQGFASGIPNPSVSPIGQVSQVTVPSITPGGIVPLFSKSTMIQSGEWVSIYGNNLAAVTTTWDNDFPTSLGGTSVTIDNKPAYLLFVSPGQINLQVPDDTATGTVSVVVTTGAGSAMSTVTMGQFAPSFMLLDTKHVSGIILRADGRGAFGGGSYDVLGPAGNSLGYPTVPAKAGQNVVLFALGLGPTSPTVAAGQPFSGNAPINNTLNLYVNNIPVKTTYAGVSGAGLYQINLRIPYGLGTGDLPLRALVGGLQTQAGVVIPLDDPPNSGGGSSGTVVQPVYSSHPVFFSSFPPTNSGTGGSSQARKARFEPRKLRFTPK